MFPLGDDNPKLLFPYATLLLIVLTSLAWFFLQGAGSEPQLSASVCTLGLIAGELLQQLPPGTSLQIGPQLYCVMDDIPDWSTAITYMFMHGGWMHLLGNLWFLWVFGRSVEDAMGPFRFVSFYVVCGLAAAALQIAFAPASAIPLVGASGAIGGVMGAYLMLYPKVRVNMLIFLLIFITTIRIPAMFMLVYWLGLQFLGGLSSIGNDVGGVAFWAHIGGFVTGALLIWLWIKPELLRRHPYYGWSTTPKDA
jgi:membrane associated rhomboid family serine protease